MRSAVVSFFVSLVPCIAAAQMVTPNAIPVGVIPVVFLDGYQLGCTGDSSFQTNFGSADTVLQASGLVTVYFDNCTDKGASIEGLGAAFGAFLGSLTYTNGTPVPRVDIVAHSMGGLIVRAYLSGMQPITTGSAATFTPPANPGIRRAVFLATPHFGTYVASDLGDDTQTHEMALGSQFLFDLNTWNQGTDDLRGIDALAIAGDGGTGLESTLAGSDLSGFDDGIVELTSASIGFAISGRTRVVPDCHTTDALLVDLGVCSSGTPALNAINDTSNVVGQIITSFLTGTNTWTTLGQAIEDNSNYNYGGLIVGGADPNGATESITSAADGLGLNSGIAYREAVQMQEWLDPVLNVNVTGSGQVALTPQFIAGSTVAVTAKSGPSITGVVPAGIAQFPRDVAPGAFVTIYGSNLADAEAQAGQPYPTQLADVQVMVNETAAQLQYVNSNQINFIFPNVSLPSAGSLFLHLTLTNSAGQQTVSTVVVPAVPSIFTFTGVANGPAAAENAVTGAIINANNALNAGDYVALFLTGLGQGLTTTVTVNGQNCAGTFFFAGPVASYEGLDQVNCQIPTGITGATVPVVVTTNGCASNTATLNIQ